MIRVVTEAASERSLVHISTRDVLRICVLKTEFSSQVAQGSETDCDWLLLKEEERKKKKETKKLVFLDNSFTSLSESPR